MVPAPTPGLDHPGSPLDSPPQSPAPAAAPREKDGNRRQAKRGCRPSKDSFAMEEFSPLHFSFSKAKKQGALGGAHQKSV